MKVYKKIILLILCGILLILVGCFYRTNGYLYSSFSEFLADPFRTAKETEYRSIELSTIDITGDAKFCLEKNADNVLCLTMYTIDEHNGVKFNPRHDLLQGVQSHKKKKELYYIIANEGFGIVDIAHKSCKLYILIPDSEYVSSTYSLDENGNRLYKNRKILDPNITYLNSFDEFTKNEQKIFEKMEWC